jgi:hypothetical protein
MRRQKKSRRSEHQIFGTLQNPEAHKNAISNEEYQAMRARERNAIEQHRLELLQKAARALEADPPKDLVLEPPSAEPATTASSAAPEPPSSASPDELAARELISQLQEAFPDFLPATPVSTPRTRKRPLARNRRQLPAASAEPASVDRHRRRCTICKHRDRESIEQDFLHWHSIRDIAWTHEIDDTRAITRHAVATGLRTQRRKNLLFAAENVASRADEAKVTGSNVLQAIRVCTQITDTGEWIDAPSRLVISTESNAPAPRPTVPPRLTGPRPMLQLHIADPANVSNQSDTSPISNRYAPRLENAVTAWKQRAATFLIGCFSPLFRAFAKPKNLVATPKISR